MIQEKHACNVIVPTPLQYTINKGHSSKYMEFWEACENYIQGNIETAVDDRQHDPIEHLAVAMSVPDLLSEVSKKVEPGTPIPSVQWL